MNATNGACTWYQGVPNGLCRALCWRSCKAFIEVESLDIVLDGHFGFVSSNMRRVSEKETRLEGQCLGLGQHLCDWV